MAGLIIDQDKCSKCGTCLSLCPERFGAVVKVSGKKVEVPSQPIPVIPKKKKAPNETTSDT